MERHEIPAAITHHLQPLQQRLTRAREQVQALKAQLYDAAHEQAEATGAAVAAANAAIAAMELDTAKRWTLAPDGKYFVSEEQSDGMDS